jgi:hypothetical protein
MTQMRRAGPKKKGINYRSHDSNLVKVVTFSDEQWRRIAETTPLPDNARFRIGAAIAHYRSEKAAERTSLTTKRSVKKIRDYATKLGREIHKLLHDPIFFTAGLPHWSSTPKPQASDFDQLRANLEQLQAEMEKTQSRMQMTPGRKSTRLLEGLVKRLNWIQADATEDNVKRSTKILGDRPFNKYINLCCHIADPALTPAQIDRALRKQISEFHDILSNDGFDTSVGKNVDEKHQPKSRRSRAYVGGHLKYRKEDVLKYLRAKQKKSNRK